MAWFVPAFVLMIHTWAAHHSARRRRWETIWAFVAIWGATLVFSVWQIMANSGWENSVYSSLVYLLAMPALVGVLLGTAWAFTRRRLRRVI